MNSQIDIPTYTKLSVYIAHNECPSCAGFLCIIYTNEYDPIVDPDRHIYDMCLLCSCISNIDYSTFEDNYDITNDKAIVYLI
jgi:hypothetical protein